MSDEMTPEPVKEQWFPMICPDCQRSAYKINFPEVQARRSITPDMLIATDDAALPPDLGTALECPYCNKPLAIATIYPLVGGGWEIRFRWVGLIGETT